MTLVAMDTLIVYVTNKHHNKHKYSAISNSQAADEHACRESDTDRCLRIRVAYNLRHCKLIHQLHFITCA